MCVVMKIYCLHDNQLSNYDNFDSCHKYVLWDTDRVVNHKTKNFQKIFFTQTRAYNIPKWVRDVEGSLHTRNSPPAHPCFHNINNKKAP